MRRHATDVEQVLWRHLRDRRLEGAKFRRQVPLGPFIADFVCLDAMLVIELDGGQHAAEVPSRQRWLEADGFRVLRFWNNEIVENLDGVLAAIAQALTQPSPGGRGCAVLSPGDGTT